MPHNHPASACWSLLPHCRFLLGSSPIRKNSKYHRKGDVYPVFGGSVNGEVYEETIMQDVYPALDEAAKKLKLKEVEFQEDNASPHQKVREKLKKHGAERASVWVGRKAKITYVKQSAKSPDLNADDLYVWRVLNRHVQKRLWKEYRWQRKTTELM